MDPRQGLPAAFATAIEGAHPLREEGALPPAGPAASFEKRGPLEDVPDAAFRGQPPAIRAQENLRALPYAPHPLATPAPNTRGLHPPSHRGAGGEPDHRHRWVLAALVVAAVGVRWLRWESTAVLFNDGPVFLALARAAAAGDWAALFAHPFHPLYPLATAAVHALGSPFGLGWESAGALTSALAGGLSVLALYAFVRRAFGSFEALVAAGLLAFHAVATEHSGDIQSEGLYLALFLAASAALWQALAEGRRDLAFLGGLLSGLAYLTRPEGLSLTLVAGGVAVALLVLRRRSWGETTAWVLCLGFGTLLCAAPYVGALYWESGELWLTRKKSVAWVVGIDGPPRHFAGAPTVEPDWESLQLPGGVEASGQRGTARHTSEKPVRARLREEKKAASEARSSASRVGGALFDLARTSARSLRYEVLLLVMLGLFSVRGAPGLRAGFIASVLGFHALMLFGLAFNVGYVSSRHLFPPVSLLLGYAACAVPLLARGAGALTRRPVSRPVAAGLALALVGGIGLGKNLRPEGLDELAERRAAEWLRTNAAEEGPVATRKRRVAYYAELPFVQLRDKPLQRFVHYLDTHGVKYVIVNEDDTADYEGLEPLLGTWLEPLHEVRVEGETAWVFHYEPAHHAQPSDAP